MVRVLVNVVILQCVRRFRYLHLYKNFFINPASNYRRILSSIQLRVSKNFFHQSSFYLSNFVHQCRGLLAGGHWPDRYTCTTYNVRFHSFARHHQTRLIFVSPTSFQIINISIAENDNRLSANEPMLQGIKKSKIVRSTIKQIRNRRSKWSPSLTCALCDVIDKEAIIVASQMTCQAYTKQVSRYLLQ